MKRKVFQRKRKPVRDALLVNAVTPAITEHASYLEVDEDLCRVLVFNGFLSRVDVGWADKLYQQPNMPVCIHMEPFDNSRLLDSVDQHASQLGGMMMQRRKRASEVNEYERELRHGEEILNLVGDDGEKFFDVTVMAVLRAPDLESLERETRHFRSVAASAGMRFLAVRNGQLGAFWAASPLCIPDRTSYDRGAHPMPTRTLGFAKPAVEPGLDDGVGITLGPDKHNGTVRLNVVETSEGRINRNMVLFGGSGSGKTTTVMKLTAREYIQYGSKVIIIDPEGEFVHMVLALGGDVIKLGATSAAKLSPLQPRAVILNDSDDGEDGDDDASGDLVLLSTIPFVKSWFRRAFAIPEANMDALERALEAAYGRYGIGKETTFAEYRGSGLSYPIMADVYQALEDLKAADPDSRAAYVALQQKLRSLAVGIQSSLWNHRTSIDLASDIVCIDTSDIQNDELAQAQYYNVLSWVWSEIRLNPRTGRNIRVVIDEASIIVNQKTVEAAEMVRNMVKRIRKRDGGTTITTQEPNDFLADNVRSYGAAICNNATYKFLGNAEAENLEKISSLYHIDAELQKRIERAGRGEFALFAGPSDRTWVKVQCEDWEFELFGKARDERRAGA